jgi:hypothetical protein
LTILSEFRASITLPHHIKIAHFKTVNNFKAVNKYSHYCAGDEIENEMGGACSAYGGGEMFVQGFGGKT